MHETHRLRTSLHSHKCLSNVGNQTEDTSRTLVLAWSSQPFSYPCSQEQNTQIAGKQYHSKHATKYLYLEEIELLTFRYIRRVIKSTLPFTTGYK